MAVDNLKQLMIMIYEYVYNEGNRVERDYYETLDKHYQHMFSARPERYVTSADLVEIIERKAQFDRFCKTQQDIYKILSLYKNAAFSENDR